MRGGIFSVVVAASLIAAAAGAEEGYHDWKKYGDDGHGTYYLDIASVEKSPYGGLVFWIKAEPKEGDRYYRDTYKTDDIGRILFKYAVNCTEKTQNSFGGAAILYDRRGRISMVYGSNMTEFRPVAPGTLEDKTRDFVCRNYGNITGEKGGP
jgi:hypothetical protein